MTDNANQHADDLPPPAAGPMLCRSEILQASRRCFDQHGYDGTTIRRIAGEMNCAVGSIYRYFRDKRDLLTELAQLDLQPVLHHLEAGGNWRGSALLYHQCATQAGNRYSLLFWLHHVAGDAPTNSAVSKTVLPPVAERLIEHWARQLDSTQRARQLFAMLHGCVTSGLDAHATLAMVDRLFQAYDGLHHEHTQSTSTTTTQLSKPQVVPVAHLGQVMRQPVLVTLDATGSTQSVPPTHHDTETLSMEIVELPLRNN